MKGNHASNSWCFLPWGGWGVGSGWRMKSGGLERTGLWLFQPTSGKQLCFLHWRDLVYNLFLKKKPKRQGKEWQDLVSCGIERWWPDFWPSQKIPLSSDHYLLQILAQAQECRVGVAMDSPPATKCSSPATSWGRVWEKDSDQHLVWRI